MKNLNLLFNKTYYEKIDQGTEVFERSLEEKNREIIGYCFDPTKDYQPCPIDGAVTFCMKTSYPGLLVGTGYAHGAGIEGINADINCGFSFDYVTGQPYIPGSSVKGVLRSHFKDHPEAVSAIANISLEIVKELENNIFDHSDTFLDAVLYDGADQNHILGHEYITPHSDVTKNPVPIHIIKVLPDVRFEFRFLVSDFTMDDFTFTKDRKKALFQKLLALFGVGAKTNVGFGALECDDSAPRVRAPQQQSAPQVRRNSGGNGGVNNNRSSTYSNRDRGSNSGNHTASVGGGNYGQEKVQCPYCGGMNYKYNRQGVKNKKCFNRNCGKDLP